MIDSHTTQKKVKVDTSDLDYVVNKQDNTITPHEADSSYIPTNEDFDAAPPVKSAYGERRSYDGGKTDYIICHVCRHSMRISKFGKPDPKNRAMRDCVCITCRSIIADAAREHQYFERRQARMKKRFEKSESDKINSLERANAGARRVAEESVARKKARETSLNNRAGQRALNKKERDMNDAEREYAQRTLIRRKLLPFIQKFNKGYHAGWVHKDICERLDKFVKAVENEESPRLMLFMPPRHGKSEIASKNLPAHVLGNHPTWEIISASYAVSLPMGFSKKIHATMADKYYQTLFPNTRLHPKAQATDDWMTTAEGAYRAAGVGGGITGKGAHIFIIDDPVKDAQEADSQTQRDSVWDWWGSTAKTRLAPGGGVLVIQTRWHDDDLSGRLLQKMKEDKKEFAELIADGELRLSQAPQDSEDYGLIKKEIAGYKEELSEIDDWELVQYPAIATHDEYVHKDGRILDHREMRNAKKVREKGDPLHKERYPLARLRNMKRSMQPRHWSALYQQNPVPDEGMYFTKSMLRFSPSLANPTQCKLFAAWDLAIGEKQANDYTVGVVGGIDWLGQVNIFEILRFRGNSHVIADTILTTYQKYPSIQQVGMEQGAIQMAIMPTLEEMMKERSLYPSMNNDLKPITDKQARARPIQGMMQQGRVIFPTHATWVEDATLELLRFPGGLHDDIVDALAWLAHMVVGTKPPAKPGTEKKKSWKDRLNRLHGNRAAATPMGA